MYYMNIISWNTYLIELFRNFYTIISNYNKTSTVLISTHLIADIENILDDVIFIKDGEIIMCESVATIRNEKGCSVDEYFREVYNDR